MEFLNERFAKSTVSQGTLSPLLPLKYSFVDVSAIEMNLIRKFLQNKSNKSFLMTQIKYFLVFFLIEKFKLFKL